MEAEPQNIQNVQNTIENYLYQEPRKLQHEWEKTIDRTNTKMNQMLKLCDNDFKQPS
jgi:hypothetical protein